MRDHYLLAFLLALPALAALGHDIYMAYLNTSLPLEDRFYLSDLGWLWKEYGLESYTWALDNTDEVLWNNVIDPLLQGSAFYVLGAPFAAFLGIVLLQKIFGLGPFEGRGLGVMLQSAGRRKKDGFAFGQGGNKGRAKYKRK